MAMNKISGLVSLNPALPVGLAAGEVFMLPVGQGVVGSWGQVSTPQVGTNNPLTGQYVVEMGQYTNLQVFDAGLQYWRNVNVTPYGQVTISSDGTNFRLANTTGTPIGGLITVAGSGGTNGWYGYLNGVAYTAQNGAFTIGNTVFTITPSAGSSLWNAIVGGAINTTISFSGTVFQNSVFGGTGTALVGSAGSNYTRPPLIVFAPPPNQGQQPYILPTAICTISGGAINSVTVLQQGAGLLGLPQITVVPQLGDTTGGGALLGWISANSSQVGSGTLTAIYPAYGGAAVTTAPTFTYSGTSNPAPTVTAIMNFTVTGFTQTTAGVGYVAAGGVFQGGIVAGSAAYTNPLLDKALSLPVYPPVTVAATTGLPALAGPFGGVNLQAVPTFAAFSTGAAPSTAAVTTVTVGGASDTFTIFSF